MLSGLWHQAQRMGHPLKNTVVRMPGPSSVERRCRCRMLPVGVGVVMKLYRIHVFARAGVLPARSNLLVTGDCFAILRLCRNERGSAQDGSQ